MTEEELEPDIGRKNWLVIGITIGVAGGLLMDNLALGVAVGGVIGLILNDRKNKKDPDNDKK